MPEKHLVGHLAASLCVLIWGTTFIATKVLLRNFGPVEILLTRFVIGYVALFLMRPGRVKVARRQQEWWFVGAGFSGITLYYLLENIALANTTASNVGIIVTISPFFTAVLARWWLHAPKPSRSFYWGFVVAISGVILISYRSGAAVGNWRGDALAVLAAGAWAIYSLLITKIGGLNLDLIQATRHAFFYGILFMVPLAGVFGFHVVPAQLLQLPILANFLYLGIGACAICFVAWNLAVKRLGTVRSSVYLYLVPVITLFFSVWLLHEPLTPIILLGAALTLIGLWLSGKN
ncbi:DMT family transporter [Lacticaseibacillus baoqingensis]|uniref:DMT family transporter n=1 Tax=Lacticaseibacillus baoqingensis TaxID=2486013 RepID=A0ABW4E674_9LACO|nr:DMT family transporter [Lacticaseibacillus baoqingensis]